MSKKLGPVDPAPPPVDPFKNQSAQGLGAVVSREVTVKAAAPTPLGTVKNEAVVVDVRVTPPEPIGQVRQVMAAPPTPPPPPPPVGVVQYRTPVVSAVPVTQGASPLGVLTKVEVRAPMAPLPPAVGAVIIDPPMWPAPSTPYKGNVGTVTVPVVDAPPQVHSNEPQQVVSLVVKPKPIVEQPNEISPFRSADE